MSPGRVLIADDSALARAMLSQELGRRDYEVIEARNGAEAFDKARTHRPEVILLDVEMPVLGGFDALARMRDDPLTAEIPVVFLTGIDDSATAARGLACGAHDYLRKPFDPIELLARVGAAQRTKRLQDELRRRNEQLVRLASTDSLTGIHNRRHAAEQLTRLISRSRRHGTALSVLLLDIDHFKLINDTFGHGTGDTVLKEVATRLASRLRAEDLLARWGGEEFLVLAPDISSAGAGALAESLRQIVARAPCLLDRGPLSVTISGGWTTWDGGGPDALIRAADEALYAAKSAGRNVTRGRDALIS